MADVMITALPALAEANIDPANDILAGVDISGNVTVKMVIQAIINKAAAAITPNGGTMTVTGVVSATTFSGAGTNLTGTAAGLTAGTVTTNANLTGDVTSAGNATTIGNSKVLTAMIADANVTLAKMANIATASFMGRTTAGAGVPEVLTATQATAMLNVFGVAKGLVPGVAVPSGQFLRDDGTFQTVGGSGTVTNVSVVNANGFDGTVANNTTTPAITIKTTITGIIKGTGTAISAATADTDYATPTGVGNLQNKTVTLSTWSGGTVLALTGFGIRSTGAAFDLKFASSEVLTAARTITWNVGNTDRAITIAGDVNLAGALSTVGAFASTFTMTGATAVTFPTSGTLATTSNKLSAFAATTSAELAGVISDETGTGALVFANSPALTTPNLGTPSSGNLGSCTVDGTNSVGFRGVPQQSKSANYTTVLTDAGQHIYHPSTDANARTFTIDSNANVAYPIGTTLTFVNDTSQVVSIAITADTLVLAGTGTTGTRSLAQYGMATALKLTSTRWFISGAGLT